MLEYFAYKKYKKTKSEKEARELAKKEAEEHGRTNSNLGDEMTKGNGKHPATPQPLLDQDDEAFLESLVNDPRYEGPPPPLPARTASPDYAFDSDSSSSRHRPTRTKTGSRSVSSPGPSSAPSRSKTKTIEKEKDREDDKGKDKKKSGSHNPISLLFHRHKENKEKEEKLAVVPFNSQDDAAAAAADSPSEADRERQDLSRVLDDLNLGATKNNKAFALSAENNELVRKFTLVLKDLVNGVPTAVDDLKSLIEDRDGTLRRNYDRLPSSMKKLVAQLPDKVTKNMGPDIVAAAAESQGIKTEKSGKEGSGSVKDAALSLLIPKNLNDLITKPSAIIGMLKAIVNFLKLRWPAFIGVNVVWSVAIFLLLLVLWYCHKRGREVRLEREKSQQSGVSGAGRIEELPDDPMLEGPSSRRSSYRSDVRSVDSRRSGRERSRRDTVTPPQSPRRRRTHRE